MAQRAGVSPDGRAPRGYGSRLPAHPAERNVLNEFATVRTDVSAADFTITDNGQGDVTVVLPAGKFPEPKHVVACTNYGVSGYNIDAQIVTGGVRVRTSDRTVYGLGDPPIPVDVFFSLLIF